MEIKDYLKNCVDLYSKSKIITKGIKKSNQFEEFDNITEGVPAFITIAGMALTYSIGDGLTLGVLSYVFINLLYNLFGSLKRIFLL